MERERENSQLIDSLFVAGCFIFAMQMRIPYGYTRTVWIRNITNMRKSPDEERLKSLYQTWTVIIVIINFVGSLLTHVWPILNYSPYSPMVPRSLEVHIGKRPFFLMENIAVASFNPRFSLTPPYWYWGSIFDPRDLRPGPVTRTMLRMKHVKFVGRPDKKKRRGPKGAVYLW